jgi:phosphoribosyl 1,2-cyclic phosphate phosphodiesterase
LPLIPAQDTADVRGQLVFLGTGTSVGVPVIGCGCPTCVSTDPRNNRLRCALVLGLPEGTLLVDTPPDLRTQLLRARIPLVHATLFTHDHADHVFGLDDLRLFPYYLGYPMPAYCEEQVEERIRKSFDYAFAAEAGKHGGGVPQIDFRRITTEPFEVLGARVVPMRLFHGKFRVLGFRFGNVAYCTDTNGIPPESRALLEGLDVLILDALRVKPHSTHFGLDEAIEMARSLAPKRTYFTHMSHELEHEATNRALPEGMELAYDGLRVPLT